MRGSHNKPYVNPFVRGRRPPWWFRFSSTVGGQRPVTRSVEKAAPVASEFDWIPSPYSDGFRSFSNWREIGVPSETRHPYLL